VRGGSKIRNLLSHAIGEFPEVGSVVWTGFGPSVGKAITCAEIMKREFKDLHQITRICCRLVEEYWDPKIPELDQLVVKRKLPMIHILLSQQPLDSNELGYQGPDSTGQDADASHKRKSSKQSRTPVKEFAALGVDSKKRVKKSKQSRKSNTEQQSTSTDS
ncbi:hypothetical protein ILUMI_19877, partial [Ignelater luminosus]